MATLTGFTRGSDPIAVGELEAKILTDTSKPVTVEVLPGSISATGAITESERTSIQSSINSYVYVGLQYGAAMYADGDPTMAANSNVRIPTQKAVKMAYDTLAYSQSVVNRSLNANFQPNLTRNILGSYTVEISASLTLITGQTGTAFLEVSANGSTGWAELARFTNGNTGALTVGLNLTQTVAGNLVGTIPAGYYARIRTTGTATATYRSGQETTL